MISQEKRKILTPLQKLPYNVGDLGKIIGATSFEWLPKVQKIAQSGLAAYEAKFHHKEAICLFLSFKKGSLRFNQLTGCQHDPTKQIGPGQLNHNSR